MLEAIAESVVMLVPQAIGWGALKLLTFGRYRGFGERDALFEVGIGLAVIAGLCAIGYRFWM
jgi:hypothetical protein